MAATTSKTNVDEARRAALSPKLKGRENAKDTLCRNVTIYGKCRYEDKGCAFNHDPRKLNSNNVGTAMDLKKGLNVDSPSFTPTLLSVNGTNTGKKSATISPKAASAAVFLPKSIASRSVTPSAARPENASNDWSVADVPDFVPSNFEAVPMTQHNPLQGSNTSYDPFLSNNNPLNPAAGLATPIHQNPYHDASQLQSTAFYQNQNAFQQPAQYHLYAPIGPHNQNIMGYQRNVHDFFIPNDLREDLQKKSAAAIQILPNSQLPAQIEGYHSLVPLDTTNHRQKLAFDFPTHMYKVQSSKDGHYYAMRRVSGYRLTDERAIKTVQNWKSITNASIVAIHDAFTSRIFGDSSLFFITDYHPLSKTLAEHHFGTSNVFKNRPTPTHIPEQVLWSYAIQIANALKAIHAKGLAARVIDPTRILLTGKNRIRLNGCAIMDVIRYDQQATPAELRLKDLQDFGYLLLALGANNADAAHAPAKAMDQLKRYYAQTSIQTAIHWLCSALHNPDRTIDSFIREVAGEAIAALNSSLHLEDQLTGNLSRELENGRLVRLLTKFGFINERPEYDHDPRWSENGERYYLKLFRDYVFHQVDAQNNPVVDLGHVLNCLNKLDAGTDEKITLISRDEQSCIIVSYKELKKGAESAFSDLTRARGRMH